MHLDCRALEVGRQGGQRLGAARRVFGARQRRRGQSRHCVFLSFRSRCATFPFSCDA